MFERNILPFIFLAAIGAGIMAGFFFTFSNLIMPALDRIPAQSGLEAMQAINVVVQNPLFFMAFFGTALLGLGLAAAAVFRWSGVRSAFLLAGGLLYVVGTFLVTVAFNVPMNETLAALDPAAQPSAEYWRQYLADWTMWNHVRTITSLAALACFMAAMVTRA